MSNQELSNHFNLLAQLMELHDENPFKIKPYTYAVRTLKNYGVEISTLTTNEISEIKEVNKTIIKKIIELLQTGKMADLEILLAKTPVGVVEMLGLKGFGPKKIGQIWKELEIETLGELYYACLENRIALLKGFGQKTQENLISIIEFKFQNKNKWLWARLEPIALSILENLRANFKDIELDLTGEFRSLNQTVESLDFVALIEQNRLIEYLEQNEFNIDTYEKNVIVYTSPLGIRGKFYLVENQSDFILKRFETTGNSIHSNIVLEKIKDKIIPFQSENDIYDKIQLPFIPPVLRENHIEFELAKSGNLNQIVQEKDIKGIIHAHSNWSDGGNSLEELAQYVKNQGFEYLAISDHSKSAFYANGLSIERVLQQQEEIEKINKKLASFKIFKGIESDILFDGSLDYPDEILSTFDFVIASIHSVLKMDEEKATSRIIKAIENKYTTILGHPTGRLLLSRKGYPLNFEKIISACAENNVIIELNANPHRLDLDWKWIDFAMKKGIKIAINPDAHNLKGVHDIRYGIYQAQKGGLTLDFLLNNLNQIEFEQYLTKRKEINKC
ncbi:MAG: DNA polymerase/3'-5' exonuclease PolX [Bacteroidetes bacterium]|nr:DNA polymerase/3'-5' exonuclease PolX [Bacteroidota bacterium]MBK9352983.1 DNA polymerase/3'-5' exonuclease PolX [Bacteroidota bacterium]MBP7255851.1 DNA polymerase/3'-5' exonuclease PolX [Chitinophagales bacterium]